MTGNHERSPNAFFREVLAKILGPKLGPFSIALVLLVCIGVVAVIASEVVLNKAAVLLGLLLLLGLLAVLLRARR